MSSSKFIHIGGETLHVYDVLHDIFLKYLIDAAEASHDAQSDWLVPEAKSWRVCATVGDIAVSFDEDWPKEWRLRVAGLAEEACAALETRPPVSAAEMRNWDLLDGAGVEPRGNLAVPVAPVIEVGRAIVTLLRGEKIEPPPDGDWFYSIGGALRVAGAMSSVDRSRAPWWLDILRPD